jgi:hypothetical protein
MDRQKLVELKCAIIGAAQTDREVVRGIHLRKALELVDQVIHEAAKLTCKQVEWIHEDELPKGYPYAEMFPHSKLGQDGLGGVRLFPKLSEPVR